MHFFKNSLEIKARSLYLLDKPYLYLAGLSIFLYRFSITDTIAEEIITECPKLNLVEDEKAVVDLGSVASDDSKDNLELLLIGKLLIERPYNMEAIKRTMLKVWALSKGMVIRVLVSNLHAFQFFHWRDKDKVLSGRPWCFENV